MMHDLFTSDRNEPCLRVVVYHYVRNLPQTEFPRIKGLMVDDFRSQVASLSDRYEPATLESALAFLAGDYQPQRDLFLLTFDDGLIDHYRDVLPILAERQLQGLFFLSTSCQSGRVLDVHKNHFLMAAVDLGELEQSFLTELSERSGGIEVTVDRQKAKRIYRWDEPDVAAFKYLVNFLLDAELRGQVLDVLFKRYLGSEEQFADQLYLSWDEACQMQDAGMLLGGHTHSHRCLAAISESQQEWEIAQSGQVLREHTRPQSLWPFSYPYGTPGASFTTGTARLVRKHGFCCAFTTEKGVNESPASDRFQLRRVDTNDIPSTLHAGETSSRVLTGLS